MDLKANLSEYVTKKLRNDDSLRNYLERSSVVSIELDEGILYDLMIFLPDTLFEDDFKLNLGECFVVNDQEHAPTVFTRFKSYQWLRRDFAQRLPIALWIFRRSMIIQDPANAFGKILEEHNVLFQKSLRDILKRKYIELRSDRHNMRQTIQHGDSLATNILKANIVKIALEMLYMKQPI